MMSPKQRQACFPTKSVDKTIVVTCTGRLAGYIYGIVLGAAIVPKSFLSGDRLLVECFRELPECDQREFDCHRPLRPRETHANSSPPSPDERGGVHTKALRFVRGGPSATTRPLETPPPGPRSMIQSALFLGKGGDIPVTGLLGDFTDHFSPEGDAAVHRNADPRSRKLG